MTLANRARTLAIILALLFSGCATQPGSPREPQPPLSREYESGWDIVFGSLYFGRCG